jgi:hypothetical protein
MNFNRITKEDTYHPNLFKAKTKQNLDDFDEDLPKKDDENQSSWGFVKVT